MVISETGTSPDLSLRDRFPKLKEIRNDKYPEHVLIIPDGNGRYAAMFNRLPIFGHQNGLKVLESVLDELFKLPINTITVWGFSSDNWKRSKEEIAALMKLFERTTNEVLPKLSEKNARLIHLGRKDRIPHLLRLALDKAEKATESNTGKRLCLAIDFGGEDQEVRIIQKAINAGYAADEITPEVIKRLRDGNGTVNPADLIIRTAGEQRTSDLGWLAKNAEFYPIPLPLPNTKIYHFIEAIVDYSKRERRFGGRPIK